MTLLELLQQYQRTLEAEGRSAANIELREMGVDEAVVKAIDLTFNHKGQPIDWQGKAVAFRFPTRSA